jgi:hypothetical protein
MLEALLARGARLATVNAVVRAGAGAATASSVAGRFACRCVLIVGMV